MNRASFAWLILLLWPLSAAARTNFTVRPLSLKECIQIALEHNLDLKIVRYGPEIARYDLNLAYAFYEPVFRSSGLHEFGFARSSFGSNNISGTTSKDDSFAANVVGVLPTGLSYDVGGDIFNRSGTDAAGRFERSGGSASIELRQPLLRDFWINEPRLNIQVSKKLLKISELALQLEIMEIVTRVEAAYYDLKLAQQNVTVQEQALKLAEELLAANKERVAQGVLARLDEKQAESQVASQRSVLLVAQRLLAAQQNVLKGLLSDNMSDWQDVFIEPTDEMSAPEVEFDRQQSWETGLTMRPDFLQSKLDLERLGFILKFHRNQLYPQLDLVGSFGYSGAAREYSGVFRDIRRSNSPFHSYGAVLSIPLGNRPARNNYSISKAEQRQALVRLQQLEQNIMLQIEDALNLAKTNFERVGTTQQARLFAESALEAEQTKLENGRSFSFFVLQLQRDLTAARSAEIQALADYNKALAQLALREGTVFERNHLNLELK